MTNEQFERAQIVKFQGLTTDELRRMGDRLELGTSPTRADYTLADEIANELDRRAVR